MIWASPLSIPPSPPRCTSPTSPTPPSIAQLLCNGTVVPHAPPPSFRVNPPSAPKPLPDPPHGVTGSPDPAPDRVGPSQPPLNFVDGNGYIVLRGLVEARDCEVGWNKVMKAWGSSDEKVAAKNFELLFNAARSEEQAKILRSPAGGKARAPWGRGWGGLSSRSSTPTSPKVSLGLGTSTQ